MPVVHPAELWRESGRYDADRPRDGPVQGPRRPGHGPRDDPRGGRRRPAARHRPQLSPAAVHRLPLPDEVPRRAAVARRPDPRPRVRDEGLLQLRPRRGGPRRRATGRTTAPTPGSSSASASRPIAVELRRRDDGRHLRPRVHGPQPRRRGRPRPVRGVRLRGQPPGRPTVAPSPPPRRPLPDRGGRDPERHHDRRAGGVPRHPASRTAKATFFVTGDGRFVVAIVRGDYDVNETKLANAIKATGGLRPAQVEEITAARHGARLRLADRRPGRGRRRGRAGVAESRTSSRARTGPAGTCATSTCPATTRRT